MPEETPTPSDAELEAVKAVEEKAAAEKAAAEALCASDGHPWALPERNPFNEPTLASSATCKRCGASATVTITLAAKS